jgi:hypothetical protein
MAQNVPPTQRADFHFLYLAPGLGVDYFFDASRLFWETFKTIVIHDLALVDYVPRRYSVAITTLGRSDTGPLIKQQIEESFGERVYHDPLVYDFLEDMKATLEARAQRNEPYGIPLEGS